MPSEKRPSNNLRLTSYQFAVLRAAVSRRLYFHEPRDFEIRSANRVQHVVPADAEWLIKAGLVQSPETTCLVTATDRGIAVFSERTSTRKALVHLGDGTTLDVKIAPAQYDVLDGVRRGELTYIGYGAPSIIGFGWTASSDNYYDRRPSKAVIEGLERNGLIRLNWAGGSSARPKVDISLTPRGRQVLDTLSQSPPTIERNKQQLDFGM